ncbi:MAG TPA: hypothetical protein ENI38_01480, partial [Candidatus Acetothermia bacterium]|nr:hypothetical protein [Candidatus Acetothermia bacterium]
STARRPRRPPLLGSRASAWRSLLPRPPGTTGPPGATGPPHSPVRPGRSHRTAPARRSSQ